MHTNLVRKGQSAQVVFMRSPCRVKESLSHGALRRLHRVLPESGIWTTQYSERHRAGNCGSQAGCWSYTDYKVWHRNWSAEEASLGDSSGNGLAEHAVLEVKAKGAKPCTWVEKVAWPRAGIDSPSGHVVDSVGGDDNQYRTPRD